jgi:hypothetical protein
VSTAHTAAIFRADVRLIPFANLEEAISQSLRKEGVTRMFSSFIK